MTARPTTPATLNRMQKNAGCRWVEVHDDETGAPFQVLVMYPTDSPEQPTKLGPYTESVALDAEVAPPADGSRYPLVVLSHGNGGSPLLYRDLAAALARAGFVVAAPTHPGNSIGDNASYGRVANLVDRPRHVVEVIQFMLSDPRFAPVVRPADVGLIGHSMGGYSVLAAAGAVPTAFARETESGEPEKLHPRTSRRVGALVLLAPATPWFQEETALRNVEVPILLMSGEHDKHTPAWQGDIVLDGVPDRSRVRHEVVENGGHFSFLTPFPEVMQNASFPPSQDPSGFDREAFHARMNVDVVAFLADTIGS